MIYSSLKRYKFKALQLLYLLHILAKRLQISNRFIDWIEHYVTYVHKKQTKQGTLLKTLLYGTTTGPKLHRVPLKSSSGFTHCM